MSDLKPGQNWERQSTPGAQWRPVSVVSIQLEEVELRFLDMPAASDLERVFSTTRKYMLAAKDHSLGAAYRFVSES